MSFDPTPGCMLDLRLEGFFVLFQTLHGFVCSLPIVSVTCPYFGNPGTVYVNELAQHFIKINFSFIYLHSLAINADCIRYVKM